MHISIRSERSAGFVDSLFAALKHDVDHLLHGRKHRDDGRSRFYPPTAPAGKAGACLCQGMGVVSVAKWSQAVIFGGESSPGDGAKRVSPKTGLVVQCTLVHPGTDGFDF